MANGNLLEAISTTANRGSIKRAASISWKTKYRILRGYKLAKEKTCAECGQVRKRFFRYHPFPMPASLGRGSWLITDCSCIRKSQEVKRKQLAAFTQGVKEEPLPPRLRHCSFKNFRVANFNQEAYITANKFSQNFAKIKNGKGILFYGESGVGKTHLACAIINSLKDRYRVAFAYVPGFLDSLRQRQVALEPLLQVDLLVLDDIGSERETDWAMEKLMILVDGRLNYFKPTVFTTNFDLKDLDKRVGMRLHSRILGNSKDVLVQGPDWRNNPSLVTPNGS